MKQPHLSVYDYGQGGVWLLIDAESPTQIESRFPMLKAFADRPTWMTETEKKEYISSCERKGFHWDIDKEPSGWLQELLKKS